jgi:hypothetical protein
VLNKKQNEIFSEKRTVPITVFLWRWQQAPTSLWTDDNVPQTQPRPSSPMWPDCVPYYGFYTCIPFLEALSASHTGTQWLSKRVTLGIYLCGWNRVSAQVLFLLSKKSKFRRNCRSDPLKFRCFDFTKFRFRCRNSYFGSKNLLSRPPNFYFSWNILIKYWPKS